MAKRGHYTYQAGRARESVTPCSTVRWSANQTTTTHVQDCMRSEDSVQLPALKAISSSVHRKFFAVELNGGSKK